MFYVSDYLLFSFKNIYYFYNIFHLFPYSATEVYFFTFFGDIIMTHGNTDNTSNDKQSLYAEEVYALSQIGLSPHQIARTTYDDYCEISSQNPRIADLHKEASDLLDAQYEIGITTLTIQDADFPASLLAIGNDCPPLIHCLGDISLLNVENLVAVIGARNAEKAGLDKAYSIAKELTLAGSIIVSGLALGCDKQGHLAALNNGGNTIAIVATGLDLIYPESNTALQERILECGGLVISECFIGTTASAFTLTQRTRLQAALSKAVYMAESPINGGSMRTMRYARKYHKQCFAASFARYSTANMGNQHLLDNGLATAF